MTCMILDCWKPCPCPLNSWDLASAPTLLQVLVGVPTGVYWSVWSGFLHPRLMAALDTLAAGFSSWLPRHCTNLILLDKPSLTQCSSLGHPVPSIKRQFHSPRVLSFHFFLSSLFHHSSTPVTSNLCIHIFSLPSPTSGLKYSLHNSSLAFFPSSGPSFPIT